MSLRKSWFVVVTVGVLLCLGGARRRGWAQTVDETGRPDSMLVYATDLETHPERYARADQILVFGMESDQNIGRFRLKEGSHRFCLEGGAGFFTQIVLLTDRGSAWPVTEAGEGCVQAKLPAGIVSVLLQHGDEVRPGDRVTATVRVDPPVEGAAEQTDAKNVPLNGYWLVQDTRINPSGTTGLPLTADGALVFQPLSSPDQVNPPFVRFPVEDGCYTSALLPDASGRYAWFWDMIFVAYHPFAGSERCAPIYVPTLRGRYDQDGYRFRLYLEDASGTTRGMSLLYGGVDKYWINFNNDRHNADRLQVVFRYFDEGTQIDDLKPGEVALYEQCGYKGRAIVMVPSLGRGQASPPYDLRELTSRYLPLNGTMKSIRLSQGAGVYWGSDLDHLEAGLIKSNACLSSGPENNLYVEPTGNVLVAANSVLPKECTQCDFTGVVLQNSPGTFDFRQWDLTGARFVGMDINNVDFSGATLTGAKFTNAALNYVRFTGVQGAAGSIDLSGALVYKDTFDTAGLGQFVFNNAHLCGTSLHGVGPNQTLNLTIGTLTNALVQLGGDCATDLSGNATDLSYSRFNLDVAALAQRGLDWGKVNLTGTTVLSPAGTVLSSENAKLQLGQALLAGTSLNGVVLDYAQGLAGRDLTGIQLSNASLQYVDLNHARLYDANLSGSNLKQVNLQSAYLTHAPSTFAGGAQLQGAYLFNANLSSAHLDGANFSDASFYGGVPGQCDLTQPMPNCATAESATMSETNFTGAYLYGVDFSNATVQGANFYGAFLVGATFATATVESSRSVNTSFEQAFLQGANFQGTTFGAITSFRGAFFDFTGNTVLYPLPNHTSFPGYWDAPTNPVCVSMTYGAMQHLPALVSGSACPDGTSTEGCGVVGGPHWNSYATLPTGFAYMTEPTYPQKHYAPCIGNFQWNFGFAPQQQPETIPGERR